jgi:hypothetical protein
MCIGTRGVNLKRSALDGNNLNFKADNLLGTKQKTDFQQTHSITTESCAINRRPKLSHNLMKSIPHSSSLVADNVADNVTLCNSNLRQGFRYNPAEN